MDIHEMQADINYFTKELIRKIEELEDENGYLKCQIEKLREQLEEKSDGYAPEPDYFHEEII